MLCSMRINIISHRGYWQDESEKNTFIAFERSFEHGFGVETDIRDYNGSLVISHDIPHSGCLSFSDFLGIYKKYNSNTTLGLNIKSDGLAKEVQKELVKNDITNYFVFDMSIPDTISYLRNGMVTYIRQSDIENNIHFANKVQGFWLDELEKEWINSQEIEKLQKFSLPICIVSSELHKRDYLNQWRNIKNLVNYDSISLCTDFPKKAADFFNI